MFYADLHIHSKYSRATSRNCDLEHLAYWACRKGIHVVGTGDFTHPAWRVELEDKLVAAEPGLFRLRPDLQREVDRRLPPGCRMVTRFMLSVEISTIYKKGDKTRKVHHLLYAPDFASVDRITASLDRIGNLASDGRPILGLDSRHLLEITLESDRHSFLVPAHVWTPWFAALGSKSGFDSIVACYGDLADHVFAIETGLSSDPEMNWRLSQLDRYTLMSNSDAHSPAKLGREVNRFDCELSYPAMLHALKTREGFAGTVEFFPEEGKYHLDGHRKCGVVLSPEVSREHGGRCPVCRRPLTIGTMHRIQDLADRPVGFRPEGASPYRSLIPLPEVISEIVGTGANSKTVARNYEHLLRHIGDEFYILERAPTEDLARAGMPQLAEAVTRMRAGRVIRQPGYDGEYGVIRVFEDGELEHSGRRGRKARSGSGAQVLTLPGLAPTPTDTEPSAARGQSERAAAKEPATVPEQAPEQAVAPSAPEQASAPPDQRPPAPVVDLATATSRYLAALDPDQRAAAAIIAGPLLIVAGPGTGKTRTLTHRIAHLVADGGVAPESCLAVTFTNRAAQEMRERLGHLVPDIGERIPVMTFHGLALSMLREHRLAAGLHRGFRIATDEQRARLLIDAHGFSERVARRWLGRISATKRSTWLAASDDLGSSAEEPAEALAEELAQILEQYQTVMAAQALIDFDDVLLLAHRLVSEHEDLRQQYRDRYQHISIDEYQDIDDLQYQLIQLICPESRNLCAIGDPDQAIYSFRGADVGFFLRFTEDFAGAHKVELSRNYRCSPTIVAAALQAIRPASLVADRQLVACGGGGATHIEVAALASGRAEAEFVVHSIEQLIGGTSFFSLDSGRVTGMEDAPDLGFSDIAVLYRASAQAEPLVEALERSGMPFQHRNHGRLSERPGVDRYLSILRDFDQLPTAWAPLSLTDALQRAREALLRAPRVDGSRSQSEGADKPQQPLEPALIEQAYERLVPLALRCGHDSEAFFAEVACDSDADAWDPRADRVSLLTLHAAKGLEFRVVFLVGCEDGILPLRFGQQTTEAALAEERRLFFVGLTRAKELLCLTRARRRLWRGQVRDMASSPFAEDIADALKRHRQHKARKKRTAEARQQLGLF